MNPAKHRGVLPIEGITPAPQSIALLCTRLRGRVFLVRSGACHPGIAEELVLNVADSLDCAACKGRREEY